MTDKIMTSPGNPYPLGATVLKDNSINFAVVLNHACKCGILLYDKKKKTKIKLVFQKSDRIGNIYCMRVEGIRPLEYEYNFFSDEQIITDPYARLIVGNEKWGSIPEELRGGIVADPFDWEDDRQLMRDYSDTILYLLHVRGFSKHVSSKVKEKGTFGGIIEKIPYLKELGVTALELMPAYEFIEMETPKEEKTNTIMAFAPQKAKLNYWGYKNAFYFAPKSAYSSHQNKNGYHNSFKEMVRELHKNGLEVIMQFYFPNQVKQAYILEVLKFWVYEYHIDGIHLMGDRIPTALLGTEPMLSNIKLFYYDFPLQDIYMPSEVPEYRNLAVCQDNFMIDVRKFIKSDEGMLPGILRHLKNNPQKTGEVHYITHSNGFTLYDLVSYDRKHNEENGENNMDGSPYNYSWNCGVEGKTTKKTVSRLRLKQMKNAQLFNLLAQGTPLILSGDEFMNSQGGNNNPYCIDSPITWLNWGNLEKSNEMYQFMKALIAFRKHHPVFHGKKEAVMGDYLSCGFPDISYHGEEPWKLEYDNLTRNFGILYCGEYALREDGTKDESIYLAVNMHWTPHEFALPQLIGKKKWYLIEDTTLKEDFFQKKRPLEDQSKIKVSERSMKILIGE